MGMQIEEGEPSRRFIGMHINIKVRDIVHLLNIVAILDPDGDLPRILDILMVQPADVLELPLPFLLQD